MLAMIKETPAGAKKMGVDYRATVDAVGAVWNVPAKPLDNVKVRRPVREFEIDDLKNDCARTCVVDEVLNGLLDGEYKQRFSVESGDLFCAFGEDKIKMLVDETLDFNDVEGFAPICEWRMDSDMFAGAVTAEEVEVKPAVVKKSTYTDADIQRCLKTASETKTFPEEIEHGSDYHVEFLYQHFSRLAPRSRRRDTKLKEKWKAAIKKNLAVFDDTIGCMACGPYAFDLVEGSKPVLCKSYPLSPVKKDALSKMIKILLANDIIEPSKNAEWNSPVLLVSKGDGRWRLVVDYRRVNMLIANAPVVYPRPQDIFETVQKAFFMFLIDGRDFYFQREIDPSMRDITTFRTHILSYRFKRMPQGLKCSSAAAITPVTNLLQEALHEWMLLHCDDVLAWAQTEESSLSRFEWVIGKFKSFGMTVGWFKVWILLEKAEYVSHVIDRGKVYPNQKMVSVIDQIPPPTTVKLVQTFIGMCGYFELYIPMLADYRAVLTKLTKVDATFVWGQDEQTAFEKIKKLLKAACLYIVDYDKPFYLVTDASGTALGGVLLQRSTSEFDTEDGKVGGPDDGKEGHWRPVRFMSRSLDQFERNQENRERELRAGLYCMIKCNSILANVVFTWCTDHANIQWVMTAKSENQRIARLALWLSMYWYNLQHLAGTHVLMQIADALSRLMIETGEDRDIFVPFEAEVVQHQLLAAMKYVISESPARFSMSKDTHAVLRRDGVEVVPNTVMALRCWTEDSTEDASKVGGVRCADEILLSVASYKCNDPATSDFGNLPTYFAIDLFSCVGDSVDSLAAAGFEVCACVDLRYDFEEEMLAKHPCVISYHGVLALAMSVESAQVRMPYITIVNAKIFKAQSTPERRYTVVGDSPTSVEETLILVRALNEVQGEYPVQAILMWFLDGTSVKALASYRKLISQMGYLVKTSKLPAGRYGDYVGDNMTVVTLTLTSFPTVQPNDCLASVVDLLTDDARTPAMIQTLERPIIIKFPKETMGSISSGPLLQRVIATPMLAVLDGRRHFYYGNGTVPSPKDELINVIDNPHEPPRSWTYKQLTVRQSCAAAGLREELISVVEELEDKVAISVLRKTIPTGTATTIFRATLAHVQVQHVVAGSKVGGVTGNSDSYHFGINKSPWRADCASTILSNLTAITCGDGVDECDLVAEGVDLVHELRMARSQKRSREEITCEKDSAMSNRITPVGNALRSDRIAPVGNASRHNAYEFYCGSAVLSSALKERGARWNVVTIDIKDCTADGVPPTEILDIEELTTALIRNLFVKHGTPDYLHFAPECSPRSKQHKRDKHYEYVTGAPISESAVKADAQVAKAFCIIDVARELNADVLWTMESPNYWVFKNLPRVKDMVETNQYSIIHLSDYDDTFTKKPSVWINNLDLWAPKVPTRTAQKAGVHWDTTPKKRRAVYPKALCQEIAQSLSDTLGGDAMDLATPVVTKSMSKALTAKESNAKPPNNSKKSKKAKGKNKQASKSGVKDPDVSGEGSAGGSIGIPPVGQADDALDNEMDEVSPYTFISRKEIVSVQESDPVLIECRRLAEALEKWKTALDENHSDTEVALLHTDYLEELKRMKVRGKNVQGYAQLMRIDEDGMMVYATSNGEYPVPVINSTLGARAMKLAHGSIVNVHIGARKMLHWLRQRYWWFGMIHQTNDHTKHCALCQKMKFASSPGYGFMQIRVYDAPGKCICIDLVVLNHASPKGTRYLFTILDSFSHYADAHCLKTSFAEDCAGCLMKWCEYNGVPQEVRSDGGNNLNLSEIFKALYKLFGIDSIVGQPYAPQSNTVERFHRWLGASLRILYYEQDLDVDESLHYVLWIFRGTENRVTGYTPFRLHLMRDVRFPLDVFQTEHVETAPKEFTEHMQVVMKRVYTKARVAQQIAQDESKYYYDKRHGQISPITQGSKVFRKKIPRYQGEVSTHMLPHCTGPYHVLRVTTKGALIKHCVTGKTVKSNLRHLRKAYFKTDDGQFDEDGETRFATGQLVVVRLAAAKTAVRKWQVAQLICTTLDEDAWNVHWYNSPDSGNMLDKRYLPVYEDANKKEHYVRQGTQKAGWVPMTWKVYKGRFLTPSFQLVHHKLPANIKSILRAKFGNKSEKVAVMMKKPWMARL